MRGIDKKVNISNKREMIVDLLIIISIIIVIFILQIITAGSSTEIGVPFAFVSYKITGNLQSPMMGELYTLIIVWQNLAIDFVLYLLVVCPVVHFFRKKNKISTNNKNHHNG